MPSDTYTNTKYLRMSCTKVILKNLTCAALGLQTSYSVY